MLVCKVYMYIWAFLCAYICAFVRKNVRIRGKKTHVYRVAGMIASIRGKKPHCVIILKQMADHRHGVVETSCYFFNADFSFKMYVKIDRYLRRI